MMTAQIERVWGRGGQKGTEHCTGRREASASVAQELHTFLSEQVNSWQPSWLIVVERKGTAIVRALKEHKKYNELAIEWSQVISSSAIAELDWGSMSGDRLLIFDDMMRSGTHIREFLTELDKDGAFSIDESNVRVAVFASHEDAPRTIRVGEKDFGVQCFCPRLTSQAYLATRDRILQLLASSGSLLLDTEHLEVRVRLYGSSARFVRALQRTGKAIQFTSGGRSNITVYYDDTDPTRLCKDEFPPGTIASDTVKKCRIVQRSSDVFAIIPICYPELPAASTPVGGAEILGESITKSGTGDFYRAGLLAAVQVLRWTLRDIFAHAGDVCTVSLPSMPRKATAESGYGISHLQVMYPNIDIPRVTEHIRCVVSRARAEGAEVRKRRCTFHDVRRFSDEVLWQNALALLQLIRRELDWRLMGARAGCGLDDYPHPFGLRAKEVFALGSSMGLERPHVSALFDILIDGAYLVTHVEEVVDPEVGLITARTFEPDGELVSEAVRRYGRAWGCRFSGGRLAGG